MPKERLHNGPADFYLPDLPLCPNLGNMWVFPMREGPHADDGFEGNQQEPAGFDSLFSSLKGTVPTSTILRVKGNQKPN